MAGGKDQKDANAMIRQGQQTGQQRTDELYQRNQQDLNASQGRASDLYAQLRSGYGSLAGGAHGNALSQQEAGQMNSPAVMPRASSGGGGGAPAPAQPGGDLSRGGRSPLSDEALTGMREYAKTGGWDPNRVSSMDENIQRLKEFGKTGGISEQDMGRFRGGGVYDEFAKTGGLSDQDRANIRARGNSVIPSMYGSMRNEVNRMGAVQGGYGPGKAALMSRLGRQQAAAGQEAALNTELGLTEQINKGRLSGAEGMSRSEEALQALKTGNQLKGTLGASDVEQGMMSDINQGRRFGIGGIGDQGEADRTAAMNAREADLRERGLNMQGGALAQNQANWEKEFEANQQWRGLEGLSSLYGGSGSGEYNLNKEYGANMAGQGVGMAGDMGSRLKAGNKSWTDYAAPIAGAVAGGLTGGWGSLIPRRK